MAALVARQAANQTDALMIDSSYHRGVRVLVLTLVAFALPAFSADSCVITKAPGRAFVPPAPYNANPLSSGFLIGSKSLWTFVPSDDLGDPSRLGGPPYAFKLVYWHPGLNWHHTDETNDLTVVARRLDAPSAPIVFTHRASMVGHLSAEAPDEVAMMTGLDLPSGGCRSCGVLRKLTDPPTRRKIP